MTGGVDILDLEEPAYPTDLSPTRNKIEEEVNKILAQAPTGSDYEKVKYFTR